MASEENHIRKFRKKLRQIEHLESVRRELTEDELRKISTKDSLRSQLQILLSQILQESDTRRVPHVSRSRFKLPASPQSRAFANDPGFFEIVAVVETESIGEQQSRSRSYSSDAEMRKRKHEQSDLEELQNENNENRINGKQSKGESVTVPENVTNAPSTSGTRSTEEIRKNFRNLEHAKVAVKELKGHSDIVWALASNEIIVVSGSRDTTGRVWDSKTGEELCSLRGHTGSVNGVAMFSPELGQELARKLECETDWIVLTASTDCSIRLWAVPSGKQLKSIYTFNSITCLGLLDDLFYTVSGTDAGKVEIWDVVDNTAVYSSNAHNESVSCLEVRGSQFCSGSADGMVIIWTLQNKKVQVLYKLEHEAKDEMTRLRSLKSIASHYGRVFLGDSRSTIKVLSWRRGRMHAARNHTRSYGCTDALTTFDDLLLSSSFNLDSGVGSINIRLLPEMEYICSIHEEAHKILCLSCYHKDDSGLCIVSGGAELLVWELIDDPLKNSERYNAADVFDVCHLEVLNYEPDKLVSEVESMSDTTDDDQENTAAFTDHNLQFENIPQDKGSWTRWCSLV